MKRKFVLIIALIFAANLCFSAVFNDKTFDEALPEELEDALEYLGLERETLENEFNAQNAVAKEFVQSLSVGYTASPSFNVILDENEDYQIVYTLFVITDEYMVDIYKFHTDSDGLHGEGQIYFNLNEDDLDKYVIGEPYTALQFSDFTMHSDGSIETGVSYNGFAQVDVGTDLVLSNTHLEKSGDSYIIVCEEPSLYTEAFFETELIRVGKTVFDMGVNVLSCEPYNESQSFYTDVLDYGATFTSVRWDDGQFYANGQLNAPGIDLYADFTDYAIIIGPADFLVEDSEGEYSFSYMDYTFFGKNLQISPHEVVLNDAGIVWKDKKIPFGKMKFEYDNSDDEWELLNNCSSGSVDEEHDIVHILCDDDKVTNYYFDDEGLAVTFSTRFPKAKTEFFPYAEVYFAHVDADGTFHFDLHYNYDYPHFAFGDIIIRSEYVGANTEKFHCNYAKFDMPKNSCLTGLQLYDFDIYFDGTVDTSEIYNFPICDFCGIPYKISELEFVDDGIITSGTLDFSLVSSESYYVLNSSSFPSEFPVQKLYIGFDGSIKEVCMKFDGFEPDPYEGRVRPFGCHLFGGWWIGSKSAHIEVEQKKDADGKLAPATCWVCFDDSYTYMPEGYETVDVENVRYMLTGEKRLVWEDIYVPGGFTMEFSGMKFDVIDGKVAVVPNTDANVAGADVDENDVEALKHCFQFTGSLKFPSGDEVPEFVRGKKAPAIIGVRMDGEICRADAALGMLEGSLTTSADEIEAFVLANGSAHLAASEYDGKYLALTLDAGAFVFTDAVPAWLSGREVRVGSFVYDFSKLRYTSLSGMQYLFDLPQVVPEMTGVYAAIDYSYTNTDADSLIAITGDIVSPAPVSFGGDSPKIRAATGTFEYDMSGKFKNFTMKYEY